jgi:tetratricopeptide (TPR) repeat protein
MEDESTKAKVQYGIASSLVALGKFDEALAELDSISTKRAELKHKVRIDMVRASALMGLGQIDEAYGVLQTALPLLSKFELWDAYANGLLLRSSVHMRKRNRLDAIEDMVAAVEALNSAGLYGDSAQTKLSLALMYLDVKDWASVEGYAEAVVSDVLQSFSPWYSEALGLLALAKAKLGNFDSALELAARLGENRKLSGIVLGHKFYAAAIATGGVKGKNLAAKAVKEYLAVGAVHMASMASELM